VRTKPAPINNAPALSRKRNHQPWVLNISCCMQTMSEMLSRWTETEGIENMLYGSAGGKKHKGKAHQRQPGPNERLEEGCV